MKPQAVADALVKKRRQVCRSDSPVRGQVEAEENLVRIERVDPAKPLRRASVEPRKLARKIGALRARAWNYKPLVDKLVQPRDARICALDRLEYPDSREARVLDTGEREALIGLQVELVRGHAQDHSARSFGRVAQCTCMANGAIQSNQANLPLSKAGPDRAHFARLEHEPEPLIASARTLREMLGKQCGQDAPDFIRYPGALFGTNGTVLEMF